MEQQETSSSASVTQAAGTTVANQLDSKLISASVTARRASDCLRTASLAVVGSDLHAQLAGFRVIVDAALNLAAVVNTLRPILEQKLADSLTASEQRLLDPNNSNIFASIYILKLFSAGSDLKLTGPDIVKETLATFTFLQRAEVSYSLAHLVRQSLVTKSKDPHNPSAYLYQLNKVHKAQAEKLASKLENF